MPRQTIELKPLTADFLPAVIDLDQACFGGLWTLEGYQRELDSPNSELLMICPQAPRAESSEVESSHPKTPPILALGCFWAILEEAHITILAVHPQYQRNGLGQAVLWGLLRAARDRHLERATLEVRVSNQKAINLYERFGFQVAGRRRRYYQDTGEDALILWRGKLQTSDFQDSLRLWHDQWSDRLHQGGWHLALTASLPKKEFA